MIAKIKMDLIKKIFMRMKTLHAKGGLWLNKTQIIKGIIGEKLIPFGFRYLKTDGICWTFIREVKGIKRYYDPEIDIVEQYIIVQENRFGKMLTVRFRTNVANELVGTELEVLKKLNPNKPTTWFDYSNDEEYRTVLLYLTRSLYTGPHILFRVAVCDMER